MMRMVSWALTVLRRHKCCFRLSHTFNFWTLPMDSKWKPKLSIHKTMQVYVCGYCSLKFITFILKGQVYDLYNPPVDLYKLSWQKEQLHKYFILDIYFILKIVFYCFYVLPWLVSVTVFMIIFYNKTCDFFLKVTDFWYLIFYFSVPAYSYKIYFFAIYVEYTQIATNLYFHKTLVYFIKQFKQLTHSEPIKSKLYFETPSINNVRRFLIFKHSDY